MSRPLELLRTVEIPQYIRKVKLSNSRNPTYYTLVSGKKCKLPKKYQTLRYKFLPWNYGVGAKVHLIDTQTGLRVVKNSKSVGTARWKIINGQDIYNQTIIQQTRNNMLQAIKASFVPYIDALEPIPLADLPIRIEAEVHYPYRGSTGQLWDADNHFYMYQKAFQDVLTGHVNRCKVIIPDDNVLFVSKPPSPLHIPVEDYEDRKLVFKIYKENDPRILNFPGRTHLIDRALNGH